MRYDELPLGTLYDGSAAWLLVRREPYVDDGGCREANVWLRLDVDVRLQHTRAVGDVPEDEIGVQFILPCATRS